MAGKLKVFLTSDGLTDYYVAASSKPKALARVISDSRTLFSNPE